jgi:hypothetical protein
MKKRYQVFVSSTYADLQQERSKVIQTLMEMDCIPAGMELFPAMDEAQLDFTKKIIDDSDYYLLISNASLSNSASESPSVWHSVIAFVTVAGARCQAASARS